MGVSIQESNDQVPPLFEYPSCYPRIYGLRGRARIFLIFTGLWFFGIGSWLLIDRISDVNLTNNPWALIELAISLFMIPIGIRTIFRTLNYRLVLDRDKIQLSSLLRRQTISKHDLAGLVRDNEDPDWIILVPKDSKTRQVSVRLNAIQLDDCFRQWLASIPQLTDWRGRRSSLF
jgi:hypothetical protein